MVHFILEPFSYKSKLETATANVLPLYVQINAFY